MHCLLLSCGPSLNKVHESALREFAKDKVVYAVKLAYYKVPDLVDTLFINCCNNPRPNPQGQFYDFVGKVPTVVASSNFPRWVRLKKQRLDYFFKVPNTSVEPYTLVSKTRNFDDFLFSKGLDKVRPVGPGIMLETVLYWVIHQKFTQLTTLGFDLSASSINRSSYQHCWDSDKPAFGVPGFILPEDAKLVVDASESIYHWLNSHGCNWSIIDQEGDCALWQGIPRESF